MNILLLGASKYQVPIIKNMKALGHYVVACDSNPHAIGLEVANKSYVVTISDVEEIQKIAQDCQIDVIFPINEIGVMVAAKVNHFMGKIGNSLESSKMACSKSLMRKMWIQNGVPCPIVKEAIGYNDIVKSIEEVGLPCILKPANGLGGASKGVISIFNESDIEEAIKFSQSFYEDQSILIESFIDAISEHSAEVLISENEIQIISISDKVKSPLPYRVDKSVIYPSSLYKKDITYIHRVLSKSVSALGLSHGVAHIEFAITLEGIVLFELGARVGGGATAPIIVPLVSGVDEISETIKSLAGQEVEKINPKNNKGCVYHFLTFEPGEVLTINGFDDVMKLPFVIDADLFVKKGDRIGMLRTGNDRAGYIITVGETSEEAYNFALKAESMIEVIYLND